MVNRELEFVKAKAMLRSSAEAAFGARMRPRVYVSGPITKGDRNENQHQANVAHKRLLLAGYAVLNPMPTGNLPFAWDGDVPHDVWLASDLPWVACADLILRLPGQSAGADMETSFAEKLGIPVYTPEDFPWERWELAGKVAEAVHYETDCNAEAA